MLKCPEWWLFLPPVVEYLPVQVLPSSRPFVRPRLIRPANDADAPYVVNGDDDFVYADCNCNGVDETPMILMPGVMVFMG